MRLQELDMAPMRMRLNDGTTWRMLEPSRVRMMSPGGRVFIYRDSAGALKRRTYTEKTKADKEAVEKSEKAKKESDKKK